jgi:iron complex transport system ATP-binding protein
MILEICNVSCGYCQREPVLKDVTFSVKTGEICCLLGPNGVGKTTLLKTLLGTLKLLDGEIMLDGEALSKWGPKKRAKAIAYVAQTHVPPFPYKVKDVILLGRIAHIGYFGQPSAKDKEFVEETLNELGIYSLRNKEYTDISGGERQLVMIARSLVQEPDFLVLDEPTANLDFGNTVKVLKHLILLKEKGLGIIMTTHSLDQAFYLNSSAALLTGKKALKFGAADSVLTRKNLKEVYGIDIKVVEFLDEEGKVIKICVPVF